MINGLRDGVQQDMQRVWREQVNQAMMLSTEKRKEKDAATLLIKPADGYTLHSSPVCTNEVTQEGVLLVCTVIITKLLLSK